MDYVDVLKRAWRVTWRHKILWLFGFFAGSGTGFSSGGGSGSGGRTGTNASNPFTQAGLTRVQLFLERYAAVIFLAVLLLVIIGLVFLVISVAARGGLIHLVNEAEEGRTVKAADGWRVGFAKWWRVFGVGFLAALPVLLLAVVIAAIVAVGVVAAFRSGNLQNFGGAAVGGLIGGGCLVLVFGLVAVFFAVVLGIAAELGLRYVVLQDSRTIEALKQGWHDLWSRRGAFLMYLIQIGVGIAFGIGVAIVAVVLVVPGLLAIVAGAWPVGVLMFVGAILLLMVPAAAYAAFHHAVWTVFFRKMTGMEPAAVAIAAGPALPYAPAPPSGYPPAPPAPPVYAPAPPAQFAPAPPPVDAPPSSAPHAGPPDTPPPAPTDG